MSTCRGCACPLVWATRPNGKKIPLNLVADLEDLEGRCSLVELLATVTPDKVVFEEVRRHMGVDAAHVYGGLVAILTAECEKRSIPYEGVPVAAVKTFATGKGNADKDAVVAAARARWPGWELEDDNEADARFIAEVGYHGVPARSSPKKKARRSA